MTDICCLNSLSNRQKCVAYLHDRRIYATSSDVSDWDLDYYFLTDLFCSRLLCLFIGSLAAPSIAIFKETTMLRNITIKTRLIFVLSFLSLQLLCGGVIGINSLGATNDEMQSLYDDQLVALGKLDDVVRHLAKNQLVIAEAVNAPASRTNDYLNQVEQNLQKNTDTWNEYLATKIGPEEKKLGDEFVARRVQFINSGLKPAMDALRAQDMQKASEISHGALIQFFVPVEESLNALIDFQLKMAQQNYKASQGEYRFIRYSGIAGIIIGLLMAVVMGIWLIRSITHPLDAATKIAGAVAAGDLTQQIDILSNDETGRLMQALKNMNDGLLNIVSEVRAGTETIATASSQIAAGNLDLSSRTEEQASSLEETASAMEQLTTTVKQNADNARQANVLAVSASEVASRGGTVVSQVVDTMSSINESSRKVVDIIGVIDGIAFQTNILALNAAVEAARAGEQGRGFAVVASEVRNLAQRSAAAAKEIKALIGDSVGKVDAGARLVNEAGSTMQEIVESIQRVTDIVSEISAASEEQTAGIEQINQAVAQMDQVTQQNAALVEEAAAAADSMQEQARNLETVVSVFKLNDGHVSRAAKPVQARSAALPIKHASSRARAAAPRVRAAPAQFARAAVSANGADQWEEF